MISYPFTYSSCLKLLFVDRRLRLLAMSCFILFGISACVVNPVTGENELSVLSPAQEVQMGEQNYGPYQQQQGGEYSVDPTLSSYVNSVGQKLGAVSDNSKLPYEFVVLNSDVPNAWALPGGKIAINRGLLVLLEDEAQLAAVLGHEVVHAAARHTARQMTQQALLGIGVGVVGIASSDTEAAKWVNMGSGIAASAWQARYGRNQELQSDSVGIDYMVKAGYEPQAAVELQQTFVKLSKGQSSDFFSTLFASHPPSQDRVEKNKAKAAQLPRGKRNKEAFQKAIAQIKKDQAAYDLNQKALAAAQASKFDESLKLNQNAINLQNKEALFYITRGQILMAQENHKTAETTFQQAKKLNPNYFMSTLGLGLTQKSMGKITDAKANLEGSMKLLPTQIAGYHLGEIELANGQKERAIEYFKFAAQGGGELGKAAQERLNQLQPPVTAPAK